jgi:hypothetical protein
MSATAKQHDASIRRTAMRACECILAGTVLSGPGAMLLVELTHPQPAWRDARTFAEELHFVQSLPYFLGLLLIGGFALLLPCLHALAPATRKGRSGASLVFCAIAGALVFENYVLQTTFVPYLARNYTSAVAPLIEAFSMANPASFAWGLEMWGYGFLGVATWLVAPVFEGGRLERATAWTFVLNGWMSIAGALWTALVPGWVMTMPGMIAFALWNLLVVVMVVLALSVLKKPLVGGEIHALLVSSTGG